MVIYGINAVMEALRAGRVVSLRAGRRNDQRLRQRHHIVSMADLLDRKSTQHQYDNHQKKQQTVKKVFKRKNYLPKNHKNNKYAHIRCIRSP